MIQLVFIIACHKKLRADCDHWSVKENYIEIQGRRKMYLFYFSLAKMVDGKWRICPLQNSEYINRLYCPQIYRVQPIQTSRVDFKGATMP